MTDAKASQIKALDAEARAAGLTDHDRLEVLKFLSLLQERSGPAISRCLGCMRVVQSGRKTCGDGRCERSGAR